MYITYHDTSVMYERTLTFQHYVFGVDCLIKGLACVRDGIVNVRCVEMGVLVLVWCVCVGGGGFVWGMEYYCECVMGGPCIRVCSGVCGIGSIGVCICVWGTEMLACVCFFGIRMSLGVQGMGSIRWVGVL